MPNSSFRSGLDAFKKQLDQTVADLTPESIPWDELFPPAFMKRYGKDSSFNEMLAAGGVEMTSETSEATLDELVRARTSFRSWGEMKVKGYEEWAEKKLKR